MYNPASESSLQGYHIMNSEFDSYWGIDVSKEWLDIAIENQVYRIDQTESAIAEFITKHKINNQETLVVLESTGGYERLAVECFSFSGFRVHVAHPTKVRDFAKARGRFAKTDRLDAKILSDYGKFIEVHQIRELPTKEQQVLRSLGARLEQLKAMQHQEVCRKGMANDELLRKSHDFMLKTLKQQIDEIIKQIEGLINNDATLKEKYALLQTMKGVGKILGMALLIDLPELGKATKKEIAALVGVAPLTKESGQKTGKACTKFGRREIRKVLYMGALVACRHNKNLKIFYERLVNAGKAKKIAIVAVMRKMLVILNAMVKSNTVFAY
jgi:transposase